MFGFAPFTTESVASHNPVAIVYGNIENIPLVLNLQQKEDVAFQIEYTILEVPLTINMNEPIQLNI